MDLYSLIKELPKDAIIALVFKLMQDEVLSYEDITSAYINYLNLLRQGVSKEYSELVTQFTRIWTSETGNLRKNIADTMQYLKDKGRVNITDEKIAKYRNNKFSVKVEI